MIGRLGFWGLVLGEGESASEVDQVVADAVNLDDRNRLAVTGLRFAEMLLDGAHCGLAIGADRSGVTGVAVADGGCGLGCFHDLHFLVFDFGLSRGLVPLDMDKVARPLIMSTKKEEKVHFIWGDHSQTSIFPVVA